MSSKVGGLIPRPAVLIANPAARQIGSSVSIDDVVACLEHDGLELEVHLTEQAGDGSRIAREAIERGATRLIAAGGDGTINEVIQSLAHTDAELAIVPLGTGNVIARSIGLSDRDYASACSVAASERVSRIDLGIMNGRYFIAAGGAGLDAQVTLNLDPWWKQRIGKLAYLTEFMRTALAQEPHIFRIHLPDRDVEGPMWGVLICNTNEFTWRLRPALDAREDDGLLDVVLIHRKWFMDLMDLAARMFFVGETAEEHPTVTVIRVGSLSIETDPPVPYEVDGDPMGETPVSVEVAPQSLSLVTGGERREDA